MSTGVLETKDLQAQLVTIVPPCSVLYIRIISDKILGYTDGSESEG
jgi:hypothetical protein